MVKRLPKSMIEAGMLPSSKLRSATSVDGIGWIAAVWLVSMAVSTEALIVTSRAAVLRMRLGLAESCSIVGVRSVPSYHRS